MSLESMQDSEITIEDPQYERRGGGDSIVGYENPGTYLAAVDPSGATVTDENDQEGARVEWEIMSTLLDTRTHRERSNVRFDAKVTLPNGRFAKVIEAIRLVAVAGSAIPTYWFIRAVEFKQTS